MAASRLLRIISAAAMVVAAAVVPAVPAAATTPTGCWVKNVRTQVVTTALQSAIGQAAAGDTLKVRGRCGSFTASQDVTLVGPATLTWPDCPTGEECGPPGILGWVDPGARVVLRDLLVTRGGSTYHGGAVHNYGTLVLRGSTAITDSLAEDGGGGVYNEGLLIMRDTAKVAGNSMLHGWGGGIWNVGTLVMRDWSRVVDNSAYPGGGGVYNQGLLVMRDGSRIACNEAEMGGGVLNEGRLVLSGASKITRNTATGGTGGGISSTGTVTLSRHWHGTVMGNTPDDWTP